MKTKTTQTLESLIKAKKFDWVNSDINSKNFPPESIRSPEYRLFHFDRYISSDDAIKEIEKEGYKAANVYELLSWDGWNDKDWVVALGSVAEIGGYRYVPYLNRDDSKRNLRLRWQDDDWSEVCRFLAVRNLESGTLSSGPLDTLTLDSAIKICKDNGLIVYKPL